MQKRALSFFLAMVWGGYACAQMSEEDELALAFGDKTTLSIATGAAQPLSRAPAAATVITAEDIAAIGATDLDEVLETVPGLHVSRQQSFNDAKYVIRGISSQYNPEVLMLVNGIPLTQAFVGNRGDLWGGLPVENIARIEVIRGPGSALYGADAFAGVINITTKGAAEINGTRAGIRAGSFNTQDAWFQHGGKVGALDVAAYLRIGSTDGFKKTIAVDAQTGLDAFGTHASLAPGNGSFGKDSIDGQLDLGYDKWRFRVGYTKRDNVGSAYGVASALDPTGSSSAERVTSDLTWHDKNFAENWDITLQASYSDYNEKSRLVLFPAGSSFAFAGGGTFPNGMQGNPSKWERHLRYTASAFYTGFANHRLRLGLGHEKEDIYKTSESKNFGFAGTVMPQALGSVVDATAATIFLQPHSRDLNYLYAQDEWTFAKDWFLTAGVRHDRYSDFGSTTNPRIAVAWEAAYDLTAKMMVGRAFRAPSFVELYATSNPVAAGNPNLRPETIETFEAGLNWTPKSGVQLGGTLFRYHMRDILRFVANANPFTGNTAQNTGGQIGEGLELEAAWDISKSVRLSGNYAIQHATDQTTHKDPGDAPRQHMYVRADWRFLPEWTLNTQANWVADRKRTAGDTRPQIPDYTTVDLTLRQASSHSPWDFAISVRNLFDEKALEPSAAPGQIPGDLPQPGRAWYFQANYKL
ncbi:MAG TPA: TonB-dependent receptor [Rhodocyclaceae bacterium]